MSLELKSEKILDACESLTFETQTKNNCVLASIQNALMLDVILRRRPDLKGKLKKDHTFATKVRGFLGIKPSTPFQPSKLQIEMYKQKKHFDIDLGGCTVRFNGMQPIVHKQRYVKQYLSALRPIITSFVYRRFNHEGIRSRYIIPRPTMPSKHNGVIVGLFPDSAYVQINNNRKIQDVTEGLGLWLDSSTKSFYPFYNRGINLGIDGVKAFPQQMLDYNPSPWNTSITQMYIPRYRILKNK